MTRPPKTPAQHILHGTVSQAKVGVGESVYTAGRPHFPSHMSKVARTEAKRLVRLLEDRRTVTPGDIAVITLYAEVYARWVATKAAVGDDLMVETKMKNSNGEFVTVKRLNPLLKVLQLDESKLLALTRELGLTPQARDKVKPTSSKRGALAVVPGSIAETHPWLLDGSKPPQQEIKLPDLAELETEEGDKL
jgi:P27 family predicted phage terminase small subunit